MGIQNLNTSATNNNNINMKALLHSLPFWLLLPPSQRDPQHTTQLLQYMKIPHQFMATNMLLLMTTARLTLDNPKSVMVTLHLVHTVFSFPMAVPKLLLTEPLMLTLATLLT